VTLKCNRLSHTQGVGLPSLRSDASETAPAHVAASLALRRLYGRDGPPVLQTVDDDDIGRGQSVLDDAQTIEFRAE
jgi:hypothetical protein